MPLEVVGTGETQGWERSSGRTEPSAAPDRLQPSLVPRSGFRRQVSASVGHPGCKRKNQVVPPRARKRPFPWEGIAPRRGAPPDAGRRCAGASGLPAVRQAVPDGPGWPRAGGAPRAGERDRWDRARRAEAEAGRWAETVGALGLRGGQPGPPRWCPALSGPGVRRGYPAGAGLPTRGGVVQGGVMGEGTARPGTRARAQQGRAGDGCQLPLRFSFQPRLTPSVVAPRQAWRLLQGESPCRVRASHPPVSSLASMAETWSYTRRTRWTKRRQSILEAVGVTAHPEVLVQLRKGLLRTPRVLTLPKATRAHP